MGRRVRQGRWARRDRRPPVRTPARIARQTPLEHLVLDLARVATAEAESAATRACLQAQFEAQQRAASASADAQHALDAERDTVARLRKELGDLRSALEAERITDSGRHRD